MWCGGPRLVALSLSEGSLWTQSSWGRQHLLPRLHARPGAPGRVSTQSHDAQPSPSLEMKGPRQDTCLHTQAGSTMPGTQESPPLGKLWNDQKDTRCSLSSEKVHTHQQNEPQGFLQSLRTGTTDLTGFVLPPGPCDHCTWSGDLAGWLSP